MPVIVSYTKDALGNVVLALTENLDPVIDSLGRVGFGIAVPDTKVAINKDLKIYRSNVLTQYLTLDGGDGTGAFIDFFGAAKPIKIRSFDSNLGDANSIQFWGGTVAVPVLRASITSTQFNFSAGVALTLPSAPPASAGATGIQGTFTWDSGFIYICTATNTWKRVAIATW